MKKSVLSVALPGLAALLLSGCSAGGDGWGALTQILSNSSSYVKESEDWEAYGQRVAASGVSYAQADASDKQFVSKKMNAEYADAIYRLSAPFATTDEAKAELARDNRGYQFTYNQIMVVKDKSSSATIGYCVNYDSDRIIDGVLKEMPDDEKVRNSFIYLAKDRPLSVSTSSDDFIRAVCGKDFYNRYSR